MPKLAGGAMEETATNTVGDVTLKCIAAKPLTLFPFFTDVAVMAGVSDAGVGSGNGFGEAAFGDYDADGDLDLGDFATLQVCSTTSWPDHGCRVYDDDGDGEIDDDFAAFPPALTGPSVP